jgi:hypothetical protein
MEWIPGERRKEDVQQNVEGRCISSHENKTFRSRSVVKQKEMVFGFRKTETAVTRPETEKLHNHIETQKKKNSTRCVTTQKSAVLNSSRLLEYTGVVNSIRQYESYHVWKH